MSDISRYSIPALLLLLSAMPLNAAQEDDPMRPPTQAASTTGKPGAKAVQRYYLNSIMISPVHRSAIINGRRVSIGDRVGNAKVVAIQGSQVQLSVAGNIRTLTLLPISVKKPAEASRQ